MQRTSETIGALAAALAKAQTELINPEKSLVATIREEGPRGREQSFRYAPLSSGLEIVRKVLGQREIATVQTTSIDQAAGLVNLTTVLAHSSGEWVASDWPVCPVSETASPRRMGAALTYARRYALFALVGIAGEDDLDAPDLQPSSEMGEGVRAATGARHSNSGRRNSGTEMARRHGAKSETPIADPGLRLHASAKLRERLIAEIKALGSGEDATRWAQKSLSEKNQLLSSDAAHVEAVFDAKLAELNAFSAPESGGETDRSGRALVSSTIEPGATADGDLNGYPRRNAIDKSVLVVPEPRRVRDRDHVRAIAKKPCLVCGRRPSDPHHLRFAQSRAMGRKVSDEFTVPLCRGHHRELHRSGDEAAWWRKQAIDPTAAARALWLGSHPLPSTGGGVASKPSDPVGRKGADLTK
jgi:ERF superfamily